MNRSTTHRGPRQGATVACVTLGCPKNLVDSETMLGLLDREGYATTGQVENADVAIINTCSFIEPARQESIDTILEVARHKGEGRLRWVVVAGCLAQRYGGELLDELPEVDGVIGTGQLGGIAELVGDLLDGREGGLRVGEPGAPVRDFGARVLSTPRHHAYLKISEGCDHQCAFCIIPALRGPMRSRPVPDLLAEAERLAMAGVRELNLISQDTTAFGSDLPGGRRELVRLLEGLNAIGGIRWIRLLYTHPALWNERLMDAVAGLERVVKYADMPIQHITDRMMRSMNRGLSGARVRSVLERLRQRIPGLGLRTTVIVGHPGETDEDLEELLGFLGDFRFERLGVFPYSREERTPAGEAEEQVPDQVVQERLERVTGLARRLALELNAQRVGKTIEVMVDGPPAGGRTPARSTWDAPEIDGAVTVLGIDAPPGSIVPVKVVACGPHDLVAEPVVAGAPGSAAVRFRRAPDSVDAAGIPSIRSGANDAPRAAEVLGASGEVDG